MSGSSVSLWPKNNHVFAEQQCDFICSQLELEFESSKDLDSPFEQSCQKIEIEEEQFEADPLLDYSKLIAFKERLNYSNNKTSVVLNFVEYVVPPPRFVLA